MIDNSDNLDDSILSPETPSLADESDEDLISPGFKKLMYLGVFILFTGIILVIGMLSKQIARALIGASLLTIVFFVLFFVIIWLVLVERLEPIFSNFMKAELDV